MWKDCGYLALSKSGKKVLIVIKHVRYIVDLQLARDVLDRRQPYTLIYEPEHEEKKLDG